METPVTREGLKMYDHLSPEEALIQAWIRPGPHPAAHAAAQTELLLVARRIMPLVYKALMRLNNEREKKIMADGRLIREADERLSVNRLGSSWIREADKDLAIMLKLRNRIEELTKEQNND